MDNRWTLEFFLVILSHLLLFCCACWVVCPLLHKGVRLFLRKIEPSIKISDIQSYYEKRYRFFIREVDRVEKTNLGDGAYSLRKLTTEQTCLEILTSFTVDGGVLVVDTSSSIFLNRKRGAAPVSGYIYELTDNELLALERSVELTLEKIKTVREDRTSTKDFFASLDEGEEN